MRGMLTTLLFLFGPLSQLVLKLIPRIDYNKQRGTARSAIVSVIIMWVLLAGMNQFLIFDCDILTTYSSVSLFHISAFTETCALPALSHYSEAVVLERGWKTKQAEILEILPTASYAAEYCLFEALAPTGFMGGPFFSTDRPVLMMA